MALGYSGYESRNWSLFVTSEEEEATTLAKSIFLFSVLLTSPALVCPVPFPQSILITAAKAQIDLVTFLSKIHQGFLSNSKQKTKSIQQALSDVSTIMILRSHFLLLSILSTFLWQMASLLILKWSIHISTQRSLHCSQIKRIFPRYPHSQFSLPSEIWTVTWSVCSSLSTNLKKKMWITLSDSLIFLYFYS
jgi:hypothetical protein